MEINHFISKNSNSPIAFQTRWEAPSNIALIKYWGKTEPQIPKNPSLSFTLSSSVTKTEVIFTPKSEASFDFEFSFEGVLKPDFHPKLNTFFERIKQYSPWLDLYSLKIDSSNSFPHSSGIASSASAMAALSLCIMDMEKELFPEFESELFIKKASFLARLGSGSASRSIEGPVTFWGKNSSRKESSDLFATPFGQTLHNVFKDYQDTILLVDKGSKPVSSTQGHQLMFDHPYATSRFIQAEQNLNTLASIMETGDLDGFIKIVESEALSLHAMMMTSSPYFILMQPQTLEIIQKIWQFRKETQIPICFTLDAGANVHLLYPMNTKPKVHSFIDDVLAGFCQNRQYLTDSVGTGAKKM